MTKQPLSPREIARLYRTALTNTGNPAQARRCVEAYLAGGDGFLPYRKSKQEAPR